VRPDFIQIAQRVASIQGIKKLAFTTNGYRLLERAQDYYDAGLRAINISIAFVEGESLILSLKDLAVSSGSACTSASVEPSYVLRALGLDDQLAHSSLRVSFGRFTSEQEVDAAVAHLRQAVTKLRELSPGWARYREAAADGAGERAAY